MSLANCLRCRVVATSTSEAAGGTNVSNPAGVEKYKVKGWRTCAGLTVRTIAGSPHQKCRATSWRISRRESVGTRPSTRRIRKRAFMASTAGLHSGMDRRARRRALTALPGTPNHDSSVGRNGLLGRVPERHWPLELVSTKPREQVRAVRPTRCSK